VNDESEPNCLARCKQWSGQVAHGSLGKRTWKMVKKKAAKKAPAKKAAKKAAAKKK
jgi:hypothetical protein